MEQKARQIPAFTAEADGRLHEIVTPCGISLPYHPQMSKGEHPQVHQVSGLWDTGATGSVITEKTAQLLNLVPITKCEVHHAGGVSLENVYLVNIFLPNNVAVPMVRVTECKDTNGRFGLIVGMDIITRGDFAITNMGGKTTVSFRMPSMGTIDFVGDDKPVKIDGKINHTSTPALNAPCPCGSGKKYKRCHGLKT